MDTSTSLWAVCIGMGVGCVLFHVIALIFLATVTQARFGLKTKP